MNLDFIGRLYRVMMEVTYSTPRLARVLQSCAADVAQLVSDSVFGW